MDDSRYSSPIDPGQPDEHDLVRAAKRGDLAAFSEIYRRHRAYLVRFVEGRGADRVLAEEVVQETFARAFAAFDRFDPSRPLTPWLGTIAARVLIDSYRDRGRVIALPQDRAVLHRPYDSTVERVMSAEGVRMLERAIDQLPTRQKRVLLASTLDERSPAELAARENISEASVVSLVYRARRAVRRNMRRLVVLVLGMRITGRRLRDEVDGAAVWMGQAQVAVGGSVAWMCWSMALFLAIGAGSTAVAPTLRATPVAAGSARVGSVQPVADRSLTGEPGAGRDRGGPPYRHPGLAISTRTGEVRDHAVMPSDGIVTVEVAGIEITAKYACDGNLSDVLPDSGPVRSGC